MITSEGTGLSAATRAVYPPRAVSATRCAREGALRAELRARHELVCRVARRLGAPSADVEDIAQEVFVVSWRRSGGSDASPAERAWLCGIARYLTMNRLRSRRREAQRRAFELSDLDHIEAPLSSPEAALERRELGRALERAMASLADEQRDVVLSTVLGGCTAAEIARSTAVPTATVASRLRLARRALRRSLSSVAGG